MISAAGIKGGLASRAAISTAQVAADTEQVMAVTTVNSLFFIFGFQPDYRLVVCLFLVAPNAGIERIAALELDSNNIALRMVVCALGTLVDLRAIDELISLYH